MPLNLKKSILTRVKMLDFLEKFTAIPDNKFQTIYLPPHLPSIELKNILKDLPYSADIDEKLTDISVGSSTGVIVFWSAEKKYLVVPPFPITEKSIIPTFDTASLHSMLNKDYHIGIVLVRLGSYAIGVCRGEELISVKAGTGLIHGRHRQGGSSAHRFERHRDKQIESFLIRVCGYIREKLEPHAKTMDYIVYGGARTTILMLQKYCPLLGKLDKPTLPCWIYRNRVEQYWKQSLAAFGQVQSTSGLKTNWRTLAVPLIALSPAAAHRRFSR